MEKLRFYSICRFVICKVFKMWDLSPGLSVSINGALRDKLWPLHLRSLVYSACLLCQPPEIRSGSPSAFVFLLERIGPARKHLSPSCSLCPQLCALRVRGRGLPKAGCGERLAQLLGR